LVELRREIEFRELETQKKLLESFQILQLCSRQESRISWWLWCYHKCRYIFCKYSYKI